MRSPIRSPRARRSALAVASALGCISVAFAIASCATSNDEATSANDDAAPAADSASRDTSTNNASDSSCEAGDASDASCTTTELSCAEADFCTVPTSVDVRYSLTAVWGTTPTDVWAIGSRGTIIRWTGASWGSVPSKRTETLRAIWGSSPSDVWIVAAMNVILHGTGSPDGSPAISLVGPIYPDDPTNWQGKLLTSVWGAEGKVFVAGNQLNSGSVWRHTAPVVEDPDLAPYEWERAYQTCQQGPCLDINGLWGASTSNIWIIGNHGTVLHSKSTDGGADQWELSPSLAKANLNGIWGSSASDVWIVGDAGTIRHWTDDGTGHWAVIPPPTSENLHAVWGTGPTDVWTVGDAGTILHWDGDTWSTATATFPVGEKPRLNGVWGSSPYDVWVVGERGLALHFTGAKSGTGKRKGPR